MVFDIIAAAVLIAVGLFVIFFSIDSDANDSKLLFMLFLGVVLIFAGGWLILSKLTWGVVVRKVAGLFLGALGFFLFAWFPDIQDYQKVGMTKTGIFFGIVFFIIGLYLLLF
ncbi:MAG: hypothetical protein HY368_03290 [Candidatus Aenigmarchaeota archaeon]|nr:hypothetical protein [Candidatus Aenigmarchaeota archaeon]